MENQEIPLLKWIFTLKTSCYFTGSPEFLTFPAFKGFEKKESYYLISQVLPGELAAIQDTVTNPVLTQLENTHLLVFSSKRMQSLEFISSV